MTENLDNQYSDLKVSSQESREILVDGTHLSIFDVVEIAEGRAYPTLDPRAVPHLDRGAAFIQSALRQKKVIYGITTGYGASVQFGVDAEVAHELPYNLYRYHGCGTGSPFGEGLARAITVVRANSLAIGYSGVRSQLVRRMCELLERGVAPAIPERGSVGASGDLTPLSYIAALLVGDREAFHQGKLQSAEQALAAAGLEAMDLQPKETLAIMNGTSVMSALGAVAWERALRLGKWATALTALASEVLRGQSGHFDDRIFAAKPHPGQRLAARWIRERLDGVAPSSKVQDRYSLRCAPHVVGVLFDALPFCRKLLETEINGVNDNPIIDVDDAEHDLEMTRVLHGGNFYGGHTCLATDTLKNVVANVGELLERQLVLLNNPQTNESLPANLVYAEGKSRYTHHGFKAMEITASALCAEALKLTMPASVFSRSTESHNQDKVSMGTISAREALAVLELCEQIAAIHSLALCQAFDLRVRENEMFGTASSRALVAELREHVGTHLADARMDLDIEKVCELHRQRKLSFAELSEEELADFAATGYPSERA